jgi:RNA polymerase sigma factor (sigma-70 family)
VQSCKRGEEAAFRQLYLQYSKAMYNICMRMLNNTDDAKDVLQDSFISAFANIKQLNETSGFGPWLKRIVINRCIDALKKRNRNLISLNDEAIIPGEQGTEEEPTEYNIHEIAEAIRKLPDGYRLVLTLVLFEDFSHKMIANQLNISEGTSKSQYSRARKKLVELMRKNKP